MLGNKINYSDTKTLLEREQQVPPKRRILSVCILSVITLLMLLFPFFVSGYWVRIMTNVFMFATLTGAVNIITGYGGYPAIGNVVFFGLGAYTTGIAMSLWGFKFFPALLLAGFVGVFYAMILGIPILRIKGHYFVMATIGLAELTKEIFLNIKASGGGSGMTLPIPSFEPVISNLFFYFSMLFIMVACVVTTWFVEHSRIGFALMTIQANEQVAEVMGINTTWYKVLGWSISAFFTALAGSVYAYWSTFIIPFDVFSILISLKFIIMLLIGGMGTVFGPVIGAFVVELFGELIWGRFPMFHYAIFGTLIIIIVIFIPKGIMVFLRQLGGNLRKKGVRHFGDYLRGKRHS